jgi:hypothetical protein
MPQPTPDQEFSRLCAAVKNASRVPNAKSKRLKQNYAEPATVTASALILFQALNKFGKPLGPLSRSGDDNADLPEGRSVDKVGNRLVTILPDNRG